MKKIVIFILTLVISGLNALVSQTVTGTLTSARDGVTLPGVNDPDQRENCRSNN